MIKLIILLLLAECNNESNNTTNKKVEDRAASKKEKPLNDNKEENKKEEDKSKNLEKDLVLTFDEIKENIKGQNLEEEKLKKFLEKNNTYLNDILSYSLIHDNIIALSFLLKSYTVNDFDLSLALEKYFELDNASDIYIDYMINYLRFKKSEFFNIFINKLKILEDDKQAKVDKLIQKVLETNSLYGEDFKNLIKVSVDKVSEETLSTLAKQLITKEKKIEAFQDFYTSSKNIEFINSYLNVILNKNTVEDVLAFILSDPLNENFGKTVSNENFIKLFKELNKYSSYEKLINDYIKNYLENSYEKAEKIVEMFASKALLKLEDFKFNHFYKEVQNNENVERLLEFCFISKVPEKNLEKSWNIYSKFILDEEMNFKLFKKFYEKSSEKIKFLSNIISATAYTPFKLKVINFAFEQNIPFEDKSLANIFKEIINFFRDEKDLKLFHLKVSETTLDKIKDFNSIYNNNKIGEELILVLFGWLVLQDNNKLNKDDIKYFLNKVIVIYSEKNVEISPPYQGHLERIKEKFLIK